jgi:SAM-dependent methyltransferase
MAWFKSWFDSPYYHILYQQRNEEEAEAFLDNLINLLKPQPDASMLDLGCGKGRHSVYLNEKGFVVTGIDLSEKSIEYCRQFENETLSFFVHDMRKLFRVNDFNYVFNLFTSFGYFENEEENYHSVKNACLALKAGGTFVIDFLNSDYTERNLVPSEKVKIDDIEFHIERKMEGGFFIKDIQFNHNGQQNHFTERVAGLKLEDFERYLSGCDMKLNGLYGDYQLNKFDKVNSQRLIIVAVKNNLS